MNSIQSITQHRGDSDVGSGDDGATMGDSNLPISVMITILQRLKLYLKWMLLVFESHLSC